MRCPVAAWARSGVVALTGYPDGPPLVPPGRGALVAAELADRLAELTGGRVRVDGAALLAERAAFAGVSGRRARRAGAVSVGGHCRLLPTADGLAAVSCARPDDPALLGALVGRMLSDDADVWPAVTEWLAGHPGAELAERAALLGLAATPVGSVVGGAPPAPVARLADTDRGTRRRDVRDSPDRDARLTDTKCATRRREVGDSRVGLVVDFSALWAGPLCAHLLGLAGARVVKVETPTRPDGARRGDPRFYRLLHARHESVVLDPDTAGGRRAMADLVAAADVVIEASRPRALARFGLDAEATAATGTAWVSITAYGRATDRVGFGDDVAAAAGLVALDPTGRPAFCGDAIADPLTGLAAAVRALSGPGLHDVSMAATVAGTLDASGPAPARAAYRERGRWLVDTARGPVPVAAPRRR